MILDKLTSDAAVIFDGDEKKIIPLQLLAGCKEGDVLMMKDGIYVTDEAATNERRQEMIKLQNLLWE